MRPTLTPLNGLFHVCVAQIDVADCRDCSNNPNIRMPDSYCCSSVTKNPDVDVSETKRATEVPLVPKNEFLRAFQLEVGARRPLDFYAR